MEQPRRELGRIGGRVRVPVVRQRLDPHRGQRAVLLGREFGGDVIVPGERVGLEVFHPVLDPFYRLPRQDRGRDRDHIARVHRHLPAEASADVGRDDPDLVLLQADVAGDQREHGPDGVRRLGGHPDGQLARDPVEVRDAGAGLDRGHVDARDVDVFLDRDVGVLEALVRGRLVAPLPVPDVVVVLVLFVGPQHRRVRLHRLLGIHDDRQRVVLHLDRGRAVGGDVTLGRQHRGDFLRLVHHLLDRQHHLGVRHQRRHPVEIVPWPGPGR